MRCECSAREADAGSGGAVVPSSSALRDERRGDFDFERAPSEYASLYLDSASCRSASFVDTTRSSFSSSSNDSVPNEDETTILTRTKNFTETISDSIVSPIAQRLCDLAAGHCKVRVLLHTPESEREKSPDDSVPATELTRSDAPVGDERLSDGCAVVADDERNDDDSL